MVNSGCAERPMIASPLAAKPINTTSAASAASNSAKLRPAPTVSSSSNAAMTRGKNEIGAETGCENRARRCPGPPATASLRWRPRCAWPAGRRSRQPQAKRDAQGGRMGEGGIALARNQPGQRGQGKAHRHTTQQHKRRHQQRRQGAADFRPVAAIEPARQGDDDEAGQRQRQGEDLWQPAAARRCSTSK